MIIAPASRDARRRHTGGGFMSDDIQPIMARWREATDKRIRKIVGDDGEEKMQLLVTIDSINGILQFNCDGRPDGKRPHDCESLLEYHQRLLHEHIEGGAEPSEFRLTHGPAHELFDEGMMYYQRYIILYQFGDYERVVRDTTRNMRLFRFVHEYAENKADAEYLERWWPYIIRIHYTSRAMIDLQREGLAGALRSIRDGVSRLKALREPDLDADTFRQEYDRSMEALTQIEERILALSSTDEVEALRIELDDAVRREDYEFAAEIRDRIQALEEHRQRFKSDAKSLEDEETDDLTF